MSNRTSHCRPVMTLSSITSTSGCRPRPFSTLINDVISLSIRAGIANSFDAKLSAVTPAIDDTRQQNQVSAVNGLTAFINAVWAQSGKELTSAQAESLISSAERIISLAITPRASRAYEAQGDQGLGGLLEGWSRVAAIGVPKQIRLGTRSHRCWNRSSYCGTRPAGLSGPLRRPTHRTTA